jgi:hypothetical protein
MNGEITQKMHRAPGLTLVVGAFILTVFRPTCADAGYNGLYVNPNYYTLSSSSFQTAALTSGFNAFFLFAASVDSSGDISWYGQTLCQNGSYVGDPTLGSSLAAIRPAISRIEIVIGGSGDQSFANIKSLVASQGTGSGSILYKNFQALKNATGIDAIQYDDEVTYDVSSSVAFGNMIAGLGLHVTLCPYTAQSYWVSVNEQLGNKVDAIWLQCYSGGTGNNPGPWISAFGGVGDVYPGLWGNTSDPPTVTTMMRTWQETSGITGGYMWLNGYLPGDALKWAQAVAFGINPLNGLIAEDSATNYSADGFTGNNGFGFGPWTISTPGGGCYISGDNPALFGIWNSTANAQSVASRTLNTPLAAGQSTSVQLQMTTLNSSTYTNAFQFWDANGNVLFSYYHQGGDTANGHYTDATGTHTATGFAFDSAKTDSFTFLLNTATTYMFIDNRTGAKFNGTLSGAAVSQVAFVRANGSPTPNNGQDLKFNGLIIYVPTSQPVTLAATNSGWEINFAATPCLTYRVLRATNVMGPWSSIASIPALFDACHFSDTNSPVGRAFYRLVTP